MDDKYTKTQTEFDEAIRELQHHVANFEDVQETIDKRIAVLEMTAFPDSSGKNRE